MVTKYYAFRKLLDFVNDYCEVTDADMDNYAGEIDITGIDEDGSTIRIRVDITQAKKEEETDGN